MLRSYNFFPEEMATGGGLSMIEKRKFSSDRTGYKGKPHIAGDVISCNRCTALTTDG